MTDLQKYRYQLTLSSFKGDVGTVSHYEVINSNSLIDILGRLPLVVATILEKERLETIRINLDEDIPF